MLPSRTVENYLKAILQAQVTLPSPTDLVPMGQLASTLGVVPGTATTMMKTLAEAGLVRYEPYAGVRLTPAGEKLAGLVLRRHRLIEQFLVEVMGMSWAEVHDEAEQLEHAVSDRLIDRIADMLGHPEVDPHGDPIPTPEGQVFHRDYLDLLSCPLGTPVVVARIADQDPGFLRFIENSDLKPGRTLQVEDRDQAADAVVVRQDDRRITIGMRAASKLLVEVLASLTILLSAASPAAAQPEPGAAPFDILDNSFLVEEAFNQEAGIFQNIFGMHSTAGDWEASFTQEWPVRSQAHQLSFTMPVASLGSRTGLGDVLINYRYQAVMERAGVPAFSPRISFILPTGSADDGLGSGSWGWQVNLPVSKQRGDVYLHGNAGFTHVPSGRGGARDVNLFTPHLAGSAIYRLRPMLNLMFEAVAEFEEYADGDDTARGTVYTLAPGVRGGWNIADHQMILGLAVPFTRADDETDPGLFVYLSYELPFQR